MKSKFALLFAIIAFISASFACQSAGPLANLFATPTPTFTITPSPTATPTVTPTFTPSPTPTPVPTGVQLEDQPGGGTLVTDYDSGYSLALSQDWQPIPASGEYIQKAAEKASASNPDLANMLKNFQAISNDAFKVIAINKNRDYIDGGMMTNLLVFSFQDVLMSALPFDVLVEVNAQQLKTSVPNTKLLDSGVQTSSSGIEYGYLEVETTVKQIGRSLKAHQYIIMFKPDKTHVVALTLTMPSAKKENAPTLVQEILDAITVSSPE